MPNAATRTDSQRTMARSWARVWPTARSRPSSRVRSWIGERQGVGDAEQRDEHREGEQGVDQGEHHVDAAGRGLRVLVAGLHLGIAVPRGDLLHRGLALRPCSRRP